MVKLFYSLMLIMFWSINIFGNTSKIIPELMLDTLNNEISLNFDETGMPTEYSSDIFTPVCLDGKCLPIRIVLYWDLAGNYQKFQLPNGEILTKTEHAPFTAQDYQLLQSILQNPNSELRRYTLDELNGHATGQVKVDGVSGATITGLRGHYVPEALYTSHTLWHLANGEITDQLLAYTRTQLFTEFPITYFLNTTITHCRKEAITYLCQKEKRTYTSVFKSILDTSDSELTLVAIQSAPNEALSNLEIRPILAAYYQRSNHQQNRLAILSKWSEIHLDSIEITAISGLLGKYQNQFKLETELISKQEKWPQITYYHLSKYVKNEPNLLKKEEVLKLLAVRKNQFTKEFRKDFKRLIKEENLQDFLRD